MNNEIEVLKKIGAENKKVKAESEVINFSVIAVHGLREVEAPVGLTIKQLKDMLETENSSFALKDGAKTVPLSDNDVVKNGQILYQVVIKANKA